MMNTSQGVLAEQAIFKMLKLKHPINGTDNMFENSSEAIEYILKEPDLLEMLNSHKLRVAFVIGVALLGASVVFRRNLAIKKFA